jgi:hypothetical protein
MGTQAKYQKKPRASGGRECNAITCRKLGHSELTFDSTLETVFGAAPFALRSYFLFRSTGTIKITADNE